MPLQAQVQVLCDAVNSLPSFPLSDDTLDVARQGWAALVASGGGAPEPVYAVDDRDADGVPVRVYRPTDEAGLPIVVAFHGGGWVLGSLETWDGNARQLANAAGAIVVSVDYRLAPEHPFPAAYDDAWCALTWTVAHAGELGGDASRVAVAGDSAGGNLAAECALRARDEGGPVLALQALVYPVVDCDFENGSYATNGKGYVLDIDRMRAFFDCYTRGGADTADPRISPLRAAVLSGVAPAVVITAEYDPLRDEGDAYAARLRDAGVRVDHRCYDGMIHAFFSLPGLLEPARDAMEFVASALRRAFGTLAG